MSRPRYIRIRVIAGFHCIVLHLLQYFFSLFYRVHFIISITINGFFLCKVYIIISSRYTFRLHSATFIGKYHRVDYIVTAIALPCYRLLNNSFRYVLRCNLITDFTFKVYPVSAVIVFSPFFYNTLSL